MENTGKRKANPPQGKSQTGSRPRRKVAIEKKLSSPAIDLSWKAVGRNFVKQSISVGTDYQVTSLPAVGEISESSNDLSEAYYDTLWDPKTATEKGIGPEECEKLLSGLTPNAREAAFHLLAEVEYDTDKFQTQLNEIKPTDGSDWTQEQKDRFHAEIFRLRKNLKVVAKSMDIPMKTCLAYYLGKYKASEDYRLLKTVCGEERLERIIASEHGIDACGVCGDGGSLLICDGCEGEFHMGCMRPPLEKVPEGKWFCDECVDSKVLEARDFILRNTAVFERRDRKKRTFAEVDGSPAPPTGTTHTVAYWPTAPVLDSVKRFAKSVSDAMSKEPVLSK